MHGSALLNRRIILVTLAACSALAFTVGGPARAAAAPIKLGAYVPNAPEDGNALDSYASMVGGMPAIVMKYSNVTDPLLTPTEISNLESRDEAAMVSWQLYKSGWSGPTISLSDIAAGDYDRDLRRAADLAKTLPFQVMIRFGHEMNGDWYPWSGKPSAYVAAWRHSVSVFRQEGADNVKWVWSPNVEQGNYPFARYFPGNAWVDYVGLDGYNWGTSGVGTNQWQSLSQVFGASYKHLTEMSTKPVIICETSSSDAGGDKAEWIRNGLLKAIPQDFPRVRAVMWFDRSMEQDWRVDSSQASLAGVPERRLELRLRRLRPGADSRAAEPRDEGPSSDAVERRRPTPRDPGPPSAPRSSTGCHTGPACGSPCAVAEAAPQRP